MKKRWYYVLLALSLFILSACGSRLKDGVYEDTKNGYQLIVDGENVALKALIATGEGKIKGNTFEIETSLLGLTSKTQKLTYQVKGDTVEVKDEEGNLMVFEKTDKKVSKDSFLDLLEEETTIEDQAEEEENEETEEEVSTSDSSVADSSSSSQETTNSSTETGEFQFSRLVGTWQNASGDIWVITDKGLLQSSTRSYLFKDKEFEKSNQFIVKDLLNPDGSVVYPNGMGFLFLPAGVATSDGPDQSDTQRDRFFVANNGGTTYFHQNPEWIFYKISDEQQAITSSTIWNADKAQQLANFMASWGHSMGQPGYKEVTDQGDLFWQGGDWSSRMDVTYSETGVSDSEFTIVATYVYPRDINLVHRYHFALRRDGSPVVFYSENNRMHPPQDAPADAKWANYNVQKETANEDLKNGFAAIVNQ